MYFMNGRTKVYITEEKHIKFQFRINVLITVSIIRI